MGECLCEQGLTGLFARDEGKPGALVWRVRGRTGHRDPGGCCPEPESRGGVGCLHERVEAGWGRWWGAGGPPQVGENLADHCGIVNGGEERQRAATLRTDGHKI